MAKQITTFSPGAAKQIADAVRREGQRPQNTPRTRGQPGFVPGRQVAIAKTTTSADFPTYPTYGRKFVVEFGECSFNDLTIADEDPTWTPYSPQETAIACELGYQFWAENSMVFVTLHNGLWWITGPAPARLRAWLVNGAEHGVATSVQSKPMNTTISGVYLEWLNSGEDIVIVSPGASGDEYDHTSVEAIIEWFPSDAKWRITEVECPP